MDKIALHIGYTVMIAGGLLFAAGTLALAANFFNRGVHKLLDAYGGWEVFLEYREWYHNHRKSQD